MPIVQRFAQIFGIIYLLVGILGFVPPLLLWEGLSVVVVPFYGFFLCLFAVNWLLSLAQLSIGSAGMVYYCSL